MAAEAWVVASVLFSAASWGMLSRRRGWTETDFRIALVLAGIGFVLAVIAIALILSHLGIP